MIVGIGTDMIEISRIEKACQKQRFVQNIYTKQEWKLCMDSPSRAAGNFAVKEAVVKVFGTGFTGIKPVEIEVLREKNGKPYINLYGMALQKQKELFIQKFHVSITNTKQYALAYVIGEGDNECSIQ